MKYLTKFDTVAAYNTYAASLNYENTPNVSGITGLTTVYSTQLMPAPAIDYSTMYFTIELQSDGSVSNIYADMLVSEDNGETWSFLASGQSKSCAAGNKLMFRQDYEDNNGGTTGNFASTAPFIVYGNAMSLVYGSNFINQTSLSGKQEIHGGLFANCTNLLSAANLILPATTLDIACYANMFRSCTSLTTAPVLPAATLARYCYSEMFIDCTSLNYIKCLATNISAEDCTLDWVDGVAATGTFIKNAAMSGWTTGIAGIPRGWTVQDAA